MRSNLGEGGAERLAMEQQKEKERGRTIAQMSLGSDWCGQSDAEI